MANSSEISFRAVLFRMVPKLEVQRLEQYQCFGAVLFRMVPKPKKATTAAAASFRAVLFRMVPKHVGNRF